MTVSRTAGPGCLDCRRPSISTIAWKRRGRGLAIVCAVVLLSLAPDRAPADVAPQDVAMVVARRDTLVVRGQSVADGVLPATPGVVTVVDLDDERGGGDLATLLARVAGLQMRRYGGLGAEAVPSIRGSSGAQVQVLVDGLPLADAQRGAVDLSYLPLERYDRAEVHRGLVPAAFGGIGAAGAINLQTRPDAAGPEARLFVGSFGDVGGRASMGFEGGQGARRALLLVHGRRIDNQFRYLDHNQTFETTADDTVRERANADVEQWGALGQGSWRGATGEARLSAGYFRRDGGRPGPIGYPSPDARIRHERADGRLGGSLLDGDLVLDVVGARRDDRLADPERQVGLDPYDETRAISDDLLGRAVWSPDWRLGAAWSLHLVAGADVRGQWYRETNDGTAEPERHRGTVTTFAGADLTWHGPRLSLRPAWRWQRFRDDFPPVPDLPWLPEEEGVTHQQDAVSPSLGLGWEAIRDRVTVQAHWYDTVRQPTWIELFGQPGGLAGNRELVPEEIEGMDLGVRWSPDAGAALRLTAFRQQSERTIIYYWAGLGISRPANIGGSENHGVELEGYLQRGAMDLSANVTWQEPRDAGGLDPTYEGKALPYLSDWDAYLDLRWRLGAWRPGGAVYYQSANYRTRYNRPVDQAPARTVVNVSLSYLWEGGFWGTGHGTTVTGEILNLTDNDIYDVEGYPLPGRSFRVALHWN